ncbi:hypothetical protein GCM10009836_29270 [Pseudonocardia ailaonensis]|uniref:Uncharacterized protein n=1 Tax=Pseudonocardia ailaonensis TaxID=367279 RepID=A0ABN2N105_9PSEU
MSTVNGASVDRPVDEGVEAADRCRACPHPWAGHGALDRRFCTATLSLSHRRGCICGPAIGRR